MYISLSYYSYNDQLKTKCYKSFQQFFPIFYFSTPTSPTVLLIPIQLLSLNCMYHLVFFVLLWRWICHQNIFQQDDETNSELNNSFEVLEEFITENTTENHWLPPARIMKSQFKATVLYVDMQCHVYLQILNEGTKYKTFKIVFI